MLFVWTKSIWSQSWRTTSGSLKTLKTVQSAKRKWAKMRSKSQSRAINHPSTKRLLINKVPDNQLTGRVINKQQEAYDGGLRLINVQLRRWMKGPTPKREEPLRAACLDIQPDTSTQEGNHQESKQREPNQRCHEIMQEKKRRRQKTDLINRCWNYN